MTKLRTVLVSQWFSPEPVQVPLSIASEIQSRGHDVEVLTGIPNYPDGRVPAGYRAWQPRREELHGMRVRRTPLYPSHDSSAMKRMANYLSWAASSTVFGFRSIRGSDVALIYSSPATAATAPAFWTRIARTPFVLLIQDLWPDTVAASGMARRSALTRIIEWVLHRFVSWTYRRAAHIVVISPGMIDVLTSRGVPGEKISLVYNWAVDESPMQSTNRSAARRELHINDETFVVAYAGNHGAAQGLQNVIAAAVTLDEEGLDVAFVLAGDGVETSELIETARSAGCTNIHFPGRLDATQMGVLRAASDVQLVSLIDDELFAVTMPSKVQSILSSAQPLIVVAPGDAADVVAEAGAGWSVRPGDPSALADVVRMARDTSDDELARMAAAGSAYYETKMSKRIGGERLDHVLRTAAGATIPITDGAPT